MDRPFREVHELYKILYQRAEAQQEAEKARKEKEEKEAREKQRSNASNNKPYSQFASQQPSDVSGIKNNTMPEPSPLEMEALEDALEELM